MAASTRNEARGKIRAVLQGLGAQAVLILAVAILAVLITVGAYYLGAPTDNSFGASIYASWISGVAFFVIAGAASAIIAIFPSHKASYDTRARILFRGREGSHIDYIIKKVTTQLEPYAESVDRHLNVIRYHAADRKYLVTSYTKSVLRSYIDDVDCTFKTFAELADCALPPNGEVGNKIVFLKVDDKLLASDDGFTENRRQPFEATAKRGASVTVEFKAQYWVDTVDDPWTHTTVRYVRNFKLTMENDTEFRVPYMFSSKSSNPRKDSANPHSRNVLLQALNIEGNELVYRMELQPIEHSV